MRLRSSLLHEHRFLHELSFREFLNTGSYKQSFVYVSKFVGRGPIHLNILFNMYSMQELQGVTRSSSMPITALSIEHTWGEANLIPNLPNFLLTFPSLFWHQRWSLWHLEIGFATVFLSTLLPWCFVYGGISARPSHNPFEFKLGLKSLSEPQEITMPSSRL